MTDLVDRLRGWTISVHAIPASDLMDEAADEITRLRSEKAADWGAACESARAASAEIARLRITDAEWAAVRDSIDDAENDAEQFDNQEASERADTLRGLLDRMGGCPPQSDCGADRTSVASQRCRDTGGQPFESAPTTLTDDAVPAADGDGSLHHEGSRVRASSTPTGNTQEVLIGGWRAGKPVPQPTLTDAEREALKTVLRRLREDYFAGRFSDSVEIAAVIDGLLERLGGGE